MSLKTLISHWHERLNMLLYHITEKWFAWIWVGFPRPLSCNDIGRHSYLKGTDVMPLDTSMRGYSAKILKVPALSTARVQGVSIRQSLGAEQISWVLAMPLAHTKDEKLILPLFPLNWGFSGGLFRAVVNSLNYASLAEMCLPYTRRRMRVRARVCSIR